MSDYEVCGRKAVKELKQLPINGGATNTNALCREVQEIRDRHRSVSIYGPEFPDSNTALIHVLYLNDKKSGTVKVSGNWDLSCW